MVASKTCLTLCTLAATYVGAAGQTIFGINACVRYTDHVYKA